MFSKTTRTRTISGAGGAAFALLLGAGVAAAQPNIEAIVNSTCSYPQVMAALNDQSPEVAAQVSGNPMASGWLQNLVAADPATRRGMVTELQAIPQLAHYTTVINQVAGSCQNY